MVDCRERTRRSILKSGICALATSTMMPAGVFASDNRDKPLRAGAVKIKTTPDKPLPLAGFYMRRGLNRGVHDDLYTRAVVFESDGEEIAVISVDICVMSNDFADDVIDMITVACPTLKGNIYLNASHTHGSPALAEPPGAEFVDITFLEKNTYVELQREYTDILKRKIVQAVSEARKSMVPAKIGYGRGTVSIGVNRRALNEAGDIIIGVNENGPVDRDLDVVRVDSLEGECIAVLFNNGTHGVSMMSWEITGDWCGIASLEIEKAMGGSVVASYLSGAAGDVNPVYTAVPDWEDSTTNAVGLSRIVRDEFLKVNERISCNSNGPVIGVQRTVNLPGKRYLGLLGLDPSYDELAKDTSPVPDTPLRLSALRVGPVFIAGVNGEIFCEIGMEFKEKSPFEASLFMGMTNGYASYILSDREQKRGGYEYNATIIKNGGQRAIVDTLLAMAREMKDT